MLRLKPEDFKNTLPSEDACLEWLKNRLYPDGICCPICKKITKHHKLSKRPCYCCDSCGHQVYPTSGTIFYHSSIPLKTWFGVISKLSTSESNLSIKDIQREYQMTYRTTRRMVKKIEVFFQNNTSKQKNKNKMDNQFFVNDTPFTTNSKTLNPKKAKDSNPYITSLPRTEVNSLPKSNDNNSIKLHYIKRDRTARLLKLQMLLCQNPQGLKVEAIAKRCSMSKRTVYRDLKALESEMNIPIWQNGGDRGIIEGYFLPPINFTLAEATTLFLVSRLTQNYLDKYDPNIASLFLKLNTITPGPLKNDIQHILEHLEKQPRDLRKVKNFSTLLNAWLTRHKVKITTRAHNFEEVVERVIEPYLIEPSAIGGSIFVIAYCNLRKAIYAFNLKHLIGEVIMLPDTYEVPANFDSIDYLNSAWGIQIDQEIQTIKVRFKPRTSKIIIEEGEIIHPSQINELQPDGSLIVSFRVRDRIYIRNWIMSWDDEVEVIEPESLRKLIHDSAQAIANIYSTQMR